MLTQKCLWMLVLFCGVTSLALAGCGRNNEPEQSTAAQLSGDTRQAENRDAEHDEIDEQEEALAALVLPVLAAADRHGGKLRVVATTSIIGDVVAQVGGSAIELTTLMGPGQDPHSYEPSARELTAVADADVIFVNGWNLEQGLVNILNNVAEGTALVPVSAHITPGQSGDAHADEHDEGEQHEASNREEAEEVDPHTWFDPHNVVQWVENIEKALRALDPANRDVYADNAKAYLAQLNALIGYLDEQVATIPPDRRILVTNHEALGYFAARYGFERLGAVIPSPSTLAEPSATDLVKLVETMKRAEVCTLFVENTANDRLAQAVGSELQHCETVQVLTLYTDATGPAGSNADSYIGMMRANIDTIVIGLK